MTHTPVINYGLELELGLGEDYNHYHYSLRSGYAMVSSQVMVRIKLTIPCFRTFFDNIISLPGHSVIETKGKVF